MSFKSLLSPQVRSGADSIFLKDVLAAINGLSCSCQNVVVHDDLVGLFSPPLSITAINRNNQYIYRLRDAIPERTWWCRAS